MNFELSDEQVFLQEAARNALARHKTVENARDALEGGERIDLWPTVVEAGWSGLAIDEDHGGAGLGALEAMLVAAECGRVLAPHPLLGHLPATTVLQAATATEGVGDALRALAAGDKRAALVPARPPDDLEDRWTAAPQRGMARADAPTATVDGVRATVSGAVHWVPDAPGADLLVVIAVAGGRPAGVLIDAGDSGVTVEPATAYDATRSLGHVRLDGASGIVLDADEQALARAWYLGHGLIAAESLGTVEEALRRSVEYAKERFTFGRAIGSYQAIKHSLTEVLRLQENTRSLIYYAGWSAGSQPEEFPLAASAARTEADHAVDYATRELISVHGGIGATWEHDAPLFFRRAQLSQRLLGGSSDATDRVASLLLAEALKEPATA